MVQCVTSVRTNPFGERPGAKKKDKRENKADYRRYSLCQLCECSVSVGQSGLRAEKEPTYGSGYWFGA